MENWHRGKTIQLVRVDKKQQIFDDSKAEYITYRYRGDDKGYGETSVRISFGKDGSISFSNENGEGLVYLYPEQAHHLKRLLKTNNHRNMRGIIEAKSINQRIRMKR